MTLGDLKTKALQLMNEYSNNGAIIGEASNKDYLLRFNLFAHDAQKKVAEKEKIPANTTLGSPTVVTDYYNKHNLPSNFGEFYELRLNEAYFDNFIFEIGDVIAIPKAYEGTFTLYYFKEPADITISTADSHSLEVKNADCIAYYMAGMTLMDENPSIGTLLVNQFETLLNSIKPRINLNMRSVSSVYGI